MARQAAVVARQQVMNEEPTRMAVIIGYYPVIDPDHLRTITPVFEELNAPVDIREMRPQPQAAIDWSQAVVTVAIFVGLQTARQFLSGILKELGADNAGGAFVRTVKG